MRVQLVLAWVLLGAACVRVRGALDSDERRALCALYMALHNTTFDSDLCSSSVNPCDNSNILCDNDNHVQFM
eukprot:m51a1_g12959 hypothetical protein (72) ;mRNA; f:1864-2079